MRTWQKIIIVFVGGGLVWTGSFISGIKPDLSMVIGPASAAVVALVAFLTGFKPSA